MLELPPEKASNLGLGARQFRKREAPDMSNRSEWTETPTDKVRKVHEPKTSELSEMEALKQIAIQKRDEEMEKLAETSEKRKPYSLLEMHQEKLKKQQKVSSSRGNGDFVCLCVYALIVSFKMFYFCVYFRVVVLNHFISKYLLILKMSMYHFLIY